VGAVTSGGMWDITEGHATVIGRDEAALERLCHIFETLAPAADLCRGRMGPAQATL
jgi:6-phosphogluconate dehydrogenase (decarboxylating)